MFETSFYRVFYNLIFGYNLWCIAIKSDKTHLILSLSLSLSLI
jgi:hypothetical protein